MIKFILFILLSAMTLQASSQSALEKVTLQLQWKYQFQFAGFIMAKELGYYKEAGLDVRFKEFNNTDIMRELLEEKSDFAISNSIIIFRDKKLLPVTLLATYFQRSPLVIIAQPEVKSVLDLRGKNLMISNNDLENSSLSMLLKYFNITKDNTHILKNTFTMDAFIKRKTDAVVAFISNEVFELKQKNIPFTIIDPVEYGFSTNAINLFSTHKMLKERPELVHKFLEANERGWEYALANINEVAKLIHDKYQPHKSLEFLLYEGRMTKEFMLTNMYDIGEINENFVDKKYKKLLKNNTIIAQNDKPELIYKSSFSKKRLKFTDKEKLWMQKHPVVSYSEVDWKPLSIIEKGKMNGIMGDYLQLVSEKTGIKFHYVRSDSWPNVLKKFQDKKIDLVPGIGSSQEEMRLGLVSHIYAKYPMAIVTGKDYSFLDSLDDLKGKTIAVPRCYTSYNFMRKNYPKMKLLETQSIDEALLLVASGEADAFVGHLAASLYALSALNLRDLKVSGTTSFLFEHRYLIQPENPELLSIVNKAFASISTEEKNAINSRWMSIKIEQGISQSLVWKFILFVGIIFLALFFRQRTLKKHNEELNRLAQMIEQTHDCVIATDLEGAVTHFNRGSQILLDYSNKEMIGKHIKTLYLEEDYDFMDENIKILKKEGKYDTAVRLMKKSGDVIFADLSLSLLKDEFGNAYGVVGFAQDITERKKAEEILLEQKDKLDYQVHHDALTGLPNRMLFMDRLHQGIEKAKRNKRELALFFIDLDRFKQINDSLGHEVGDRVLITSAKRLLSVMRKEDTLARLGGDEFTIIMEDLKNSQDASRLAEKILKVLEEAMLIDGHSLYISSSIGISVFPKDESDALNLLKDADAAMYRAKDEGRNNYQFYSSEMTELAFERVVMETSLRQAIKNEEFVVCYQPQMDARSDTLIGMEALVRWNHSIMGLVSPAKFIPLAEDTGLIVEIDRLVMKEAMRQFVIWHKQGFNPGMLSLNFAVKQLESEDYLDELQAFMKEQGFQSQWLELEVTESDVMKNPDKAIVKLKEIYDLGIAIAVDDFGTGYSSLSYLKRFPITKLKIDQSFVHDIPQDEEDSAIVKAIIALGKSLNLKLIAEGVETVEQKEFLISNACHNIQGHLYSRPLPASEMEEFLKAE